MRFNLRRQYARLLGMRYELLTVWKACVQGYDRCEDPRDAFFQIYLALIDSVAHNELVNLEDLLERCSQAALEEATTNFMQFPAYLVLTEVYRDSMLRDWVGMTDWLDEFLVDEQLGQSAEDLW